MRQRSWSKNQLIEAAKKATSIRQVIILLSLKPTGGNYKQFAKYLEEYQIDTSHFRGQAWNRGLTGVGKPRLELNQILIKNSSYQSYKLKKRLFGVGLKKPQCEFCGWAKSTSDGRIPLELDHINGDSSDNRILNLRILCPNCHSLQPTHRGKNIHKRPGGGIGRRTTLKMLRPHRHVGSSPTRAT